MELTCPQCGTALQATATECLTVIVCTKCSHVVRIPHDGGAHSLTLTAKLPAPMVPAAALETTKSALGETYSPADGHEPRRTTSAAFAPGARFGDYEIIAEIARGGMGVVFKARQVSLNRLVALKMILSSRLASADDVRRFRVEAEAAARLDHPGIVPIYEVGEHEGQHFFSMGLVEGSSLADLIKDGPAPPKEAARLVKTIAEAVQYAHSRNIVHRDLKPANVLLDAGGHPKVTDFGLAKNVEDDSGLTATGQVMGTPSYMAPEQAAGRVAEVGPLADVYALGRILYYLLTGRPPFRGATAVETLQHVLSQDAVSPQQLNPKADLDIATICLKCLEKNAPQRYSSAGQLAEELHRYLQGEPITARPIARVERAARWIARHPAVAGAYGFGVLAVVLLIVGSAISWLWLDASAARDVADEQRGIAETQRGVAETEKEEADRQRTEAEKQRAEADRQRARADQQVHINRLARASGEIAEEEHGAAEQTLEQVFWHQRGWEWHQLRRACAVRLTLRGHTTDVHSVSFSPAGDRIVTAGWDQTIKIWDAASGAELRTLRGHTGAVRSVSFSPAGDRIASGSDDQTIKTWDAASGAELRTLRGHTGVVQSVSFSPSGDRIVSGGSDQTIRIWDAASGAVLRTLRGHSKGVLSVSFSPSGDQIVSGSFDGAIRIWDAASGAELRTLRGHGAPVYSVSFSPAGGRIVSGSLDQTIKIWDAASGAELRTLRGHTSSVLSASFSPSEDQILSGSFDRTIRIWDAASGAELRTLRGHTGVVRSVSFSPSGDRIVSGSADQTIKIWDAPAGMVLRPLRGHASALASVGFTPGGERIVARDGKGVTKAWHADTGEPVEPCTDTLPSTPQREAISPDGGLKVWINGNEVIARTNRPEELAKEAAAEAQLLTNFHVRSAQETEQAKHWAAAAFHL